MKKMQSLLILTAMLGATVSVHAASHAGAPMAQGEAANDSAVPTSADMAEGEVRKVDKGTKKITIKHGEIKNLDMPGMTMVFQVSDPALLDKVKPGDKVRFRAEKAGSALVVTDIRPVR